MKVSKKQKCLPDVVDGQAHRRNGRDERKSKRKKRDRSDKRDKWH